jgi:prepilin signal peptidase PulO-like enzyme (type II secretory pathway)
MFAELGNKLGCGLLNLLRHAAPPANCPKCQHQFRPFAGHTFTHISEFKGGFPCPKCGSEFGVGEDAMAASEEARFNPPGPVEPPPSTRIERRAPSEHELLFYMPWAGQSGTLAFFALVWNALMLPAFYFLVVRGFAHQIAPPLGLKCLITAFAVVGLGLAYAAVRQKFAVHLLYLSPELIRLQRRLLFRSTQSLRPEDVTHVKLVKFYTHDSTPVPGIEIGARHRRIRFGSALAAAEKKWLAWEIRHFLRQHATTQLSPERQLVGEPSRS